MRFAEASSNHSAVITAAIALMIVMGRLPCQVRMRSPLHSVIPVPVVQNGVNHRARDKLGDRFDKK